MVPLSMKRTPGWQAKALATYDEQEKVTLSGTLAELGSQRSGSLNREPVETSAGVMEPAIHQWSRGPRGLHYVALAVMRLRADGHRNGHTDRYDKNGPPRYPQKIRPQAVRGEACVHYNFFARPDPTCRGVGNRMSGVSQE